MQRGFHTQVQAAKNTHVLSNRVCQQQWQCAVLTCSKVLFVILKLVTTASLLLPTRFNGWVRIGTLRQHRRNEGSLGVVDVRGGQHPSSVASRPMKRCTFQRVSTSRKPSPKKRLLSPENGVVPRITVAFFDQIIVYDLRLKWLDLMLTDSLASFPIENLPSVCNLPNLNLTLRTCLA